MKKILIIDHWYKASGGANKSALYAELSKFYILEFVAINYPAYFKFLIYLKSFHPQISQWKNKKSYWDEVIQKYPSTFKLRTKLFNQATRGISSYDAILQIGSLFGPVDNPKGVPYFSYHDSTVRNPDQLWPLWMPKDFDQYRDEWYALERDMFNQTKHIMTYSQW